jgi:ApaG protein
MSSFERDSLQPENDNGIVVRAIGRYLPEESGLTETGAKRFVFAYTIDIENRGDRALKLIARHWWITDARQDVREVEGLGVIGQQPVIQPGESFRYSSWCALPTASGWMRGIYSMMNAGGEIIEVPVPAFSLTSPQSLN